MNAIVLQNVTKHFRKQTVRREYTTFKTELIRLLKRERKIFGAALHIEALKGVNLVIPKGQTVGIVGRNGSGKSTLLKLITGIYAPTSGTMEINGRISALLDLGAGFHPDFTGRENIMINGIILGMTRSQVKARMDEIIAFSELGDFIDEPVRTYSSGMYMRLAFAVATHVDPEILIIDEILAVGDEHFSRKSLAKMTEFKEAGKTIVLVTHDLGTVQKWCDHAAWIDGGRIRASGPPAEVIAQYRQAVALAEQQAEETGSSALSAPGLALPELPLPSNGSSTPGQPVRITSVEVLDGRGAPADLLRADEPVTVRITFSAPRPVEHLGFAVRLCSADGTLVFSTDTFQASEPWPAPLSECGHISLTVPGLGLGSGEYPLEVQALSPPGKVLDSSKDQRLRINNASSGEGLLRVPARWFVDLPGEAPRYALVSSLSPKQ